MSEQPNPKLPNDDENKPYPNSGLIPVSGRDVTLTFNAHNLQVFECQAILDPDELRKGMIPIPHDPTA